MGYVSVTPRFCRVRLRSFRIPEPFDPPPATKLTPHLERCGQFCRHHLWPPCTPPVKTGAPVRRLPGMQRAQTEDQEAMLRPPRALA